MEYKNKDFVVLGFVCNEFNPEEPTDNKEVHS